MWGKLQRSIAASQCLTVHPHMCGENVQNTNICWLTIGTPPHVWGKRRLDGIHQDDYRYTPTCVGKTMVKSTEWRAGTVHPHMCGENLPRFSHHSPDTGTPPHVWGKLTQAYDRIIATRYTPTCVGKTLGARKTATDEEGTPPHVWGKREEAARMALEQRYTPTCVGKTGGIINGWLIE